MWLPYDPSFEPAAPVVDVELLYRLTGESTQLRAHIDTGSSISSVPMLVARQLNLTPSGSASVRGFDQRIKDVPTFIVTLRLEGPVLLNVEVVGIERDDMLIGRDILEHFVLSLDGKQGAFTLVDP